MKKLKVPPIEYNVDRGDMVLKTTVFLTCFCGNGGMSKPPKPPRRPRTKPLLQQIGVPVRTPAPVRPDPLQLRHASFKGLREDADSADVYRIEE